jgi:hypothetical protein
VSSQPNTLEEDQVDLVSQIRNDVRTIRNLALVWGVLMPVLGVVLYVGVFLAVVVAS